MMAVDGRRLSSAAPIDTRRAEAESDRQRAITRRQQALLAAAGEVAPEARWYVLTIADGCDDSVDKALADALVTRWMPTKSVLPRRRKRFGAKRPEPVSRPALPGYMFVRMVASARGWAGLRTVPGIVGVLGGAFSPAPVEDRKVAQLRAFFEEDPEAIAILTNAIRKGDAVVVEAGVFAGFPGVVEAVNTSGRGLVEVVIFGRPCSVELDLAQLSKSD